MKLTLLEKTSLEGAHTLAANALRSIKAKTLKGKDLADMELLEDAVEILAGLFGPPPPPCNKSEGGHS